MTDLDILLQWTIAIVVGLAMFARGRLTPFHPCTVYLAFHLVAFCLRPTLVHYAGFDATFQRIGFTPEPGFLRQALLLSSAGLVLFFLAYSLATAGAPRPEREELAELPREDRQAYFMTAAAFVPVGLYPIIASLLGITHVGGAGLVDALHYVFLPLSALFIVVSRWKPWSFLPFAAYLAGQLFVGTSRAMALVSFFLLVLLWLWDHRRRSPSILLLLPVPVLLLIVLNLGLDHGYVRGLLTGRNPVANTVLDTSLPVGQRWDRADFSGFDTLAAIATVVPAQTGSHNYGTHYLQLLTAPVPRALWPGKPEGAPIRFFDLNEFGDFRGLPLSLVAHGWMSGGWFGLAATMLAAGGLLGWAYRWFAGQPTSMHRACAFLLLNAVVVAFFRDGSVPIIGVLGVCLVPVLFWAILSHRIRKSTATPPPAGGGPQATRARLHTR